MELAADGSSWGAVHLFAGRDHSEQHRFDGEIAGELFGTAIAGVGDVDGSGVAGLVMTAPCNDAQQADAGLVRLHSVPAETATDPVNQNDFILEAELLTEGRRDVLHLVARNADPGALVLIFMTAFDGVTMYRLVAMGLAADDGTYEWTRWAPELPQVHQVTFVAYTCHGRFTPVTESEPVTVSIGGPAPFDETAGEDGPPRLRWGRRAR